MPTPFSIPHEWQSTIIRNSITAHRLKHKTNMLVHLLVVLVTLDPIPPLPSNAILNLWTTTPHQSSRPLLLCSLCQMLDDKCLEIPQIDL